MENFLYHIFSLSGIIKHIILVIVAFSLILNPISFIFKTIFKNGLFEIALKENVPNAWMAGIIGLNSYLLGTIAFSKKIGFCLVILIILGIISWYYYFNCIFWITAFIIRIMAYQKIYKRYSNNYKIMTMLTVISLGLLSYVFLSKIRNNELIERSIY